MKVGDIDFCPNLVRKPCVCVCILLNLLKELPLVETKILHGRKFEFLFQQWQQFPQLNSGRLAAISPVRTTVQQLNNCRPITRVSFHPSIYISIRFPFFVSILLQLQRLLFVCCHNMLHYTMKWSTPGCRRDIIAILWLPSRQRRSLTKTTMAENHSQ